MKEISEQLYIKTLCNRLYWAEEKISQHAWGWTSYNVLTMLDLVDKYGGQ